MRTTTESQVRINAEIKRLEKLRGDNELRISECLEKHGAYLNATAKQNERIDTRIIELRAELEATND